MSKVTKNSVLVNTCLNPYPYESENYEQLSLSDILMWIKTGKFKDSLEQLRKDIQAGYENVSDRMIPKFYPIGTFNKNTLIQSNQNINYTGIVVLQYEDVEDVEVIRKKVETLSFTYCAYKNCKGTGVDVLIRVNEPPQLIQYAFKQVAELYDSFLKIKHLPFPIKSKSEHFVKDANFYRRHFSRISYDSSLFFNPNSKCFKIDWKKEEWYYTAEEKELALKIRKEKIEQLTEIIEYVEHKKIALVETKGQWKTVARDLSGLPLDKETVQEIFSFLVSFSETYKEDSDLRALAEESYVNFQNLSCFTLTPLFYKLYKRKSD